MESLTHDDLGRPIITTEAQEALVTRLKDKVARKAREIAEYEEYLLDDAKVVVVAYGITSRCVQRAVDDARHKGIKAGLLRLITAWPFPSWRIEELAEHAKAFVVPEVNMGQMLLEVQRAAGRKVPTLPVAYTAGSIPSPQPTYDAIRAVSK